jgi:hypothetical protein
VEVTTLIKGYLLNFNQKCIIVNFGEEGMQKMYRGQIIHTGVSDHAKWVDGLRSVKANYLMWNGAYRVLNPFVQMSYCEYPEGIKHLNRSNLVQAISKYKFFNCIYREGAEDFDEGVYISERFGRRLVVLNAERTHCYFSSQGRFYKSKVWIDKSGVVYGACVGSQYGEYDK